MQSTGQTSTQALSLTLMHGSAITYVIGLLPCTEQVRRPLGIYGLAHSSFKVRTWNLARVLLRLGLGVLTGRVRPAGGRPGRSGPAATGAALYGTVPMPSNTPV